MKEYYRLLTKLLPQIYNPNPNPNHLLDGIKAIDSTQYKITRGK